MSLGSPKIFSFPETTTRTLASRLRTLPLFVRPLWGLGMYLGLGRQIISHLLKERGYLLGHLCSNLYRWGWCCRASNTLRSWGLTLYFHCNWLFCCLIFLFHIFSQDFLFLVQLTQGDFSPSIHIYDVIVPYVSNIWAIVLKYSKFTILNLHKNLLWYH